MIILTDGENVFTQCSNDTYCHGSSTPFGYLNDGRLSGATDSATAVNNLNSKVTQICDSVRASGTLIYAVMFDLNAGASGTRTLFTNCTGDSESLLRCGRFRSAGTGVPDHCGRFDQVEAVEVTA